MKKILPVGFLLAVAFACAVLAQSIPVSSKNLSSTIAVTNTFQTIQGQTNNRIGCTIQNNGSHSMYVYLGPLANAAIGLSLNLAAGQAMNCAIAEGYVVKDAINITGTSGDAYFANFQ